jgi:hypothetical protein
MRRTGLGRLDDAGDPLDGLVNLFDVGIVLADAFLIARLSLTRAPGAESSASAAPRSGRPRRSRPPPAGPPRAAPGPLSAPSTA